MGGGAGAYRGRQGDQNDAGGNHDTHAFARSFSGPPHVLAPKTGCGRPVIEDPDQFGGDGQTKQAKRKSVLNEMRAKCHDAGPHRGDQIDRRPQKAIGVIVLYAREEEHQQNTGDIHVFHDLFSSRAFGHIDKQKKPHQQRQKMGSIKG